MKQFLFDVWNFYSTINRTVATLEPAQKTRETEIFAVEFIAVINMIKLRYQIK